MISDIPTAQDYFASGKELMDFAWDTVAQLLVDLDDAEYFGVDTKEVSEAYWKSAKRHLTTALAITQQGVEFILKGKIAEKSPFLLFADKPSNWPSPYKDTPPKFSDFRTIDAQDLVGVHDTFCDSPLPPDFTERFKYLREKRNTIMHSIDKDLSIQVLDVIDSILFMHKRLFPNETWIQVRQEYLSSSPDIKLGSIDYVTNRTCWEMSLVVALLTPAKVKEYFGIDKKQRRYFCPKCYSDASHKAGDFDYKLAVLSPKGKESKKVYCPICNSNHDVTRDACEDTSCQGNVLSEDYGLCLTCGYG